MLVTSQSQNPVDNSFATTIQHWHNVYDTGWTREYLSRAPRQDKNYQDYDDIDIVGEAATKVKVDENLYQKYTKREQTPSVSENTVQEELRKLRRMQVFMCAALTTTLIIAAATLGFVIMMKWSRNKDLNASKSMVQGKSQGTIYTLSLLEICRKSRALHELSLKIVY